MRKIASIFFSMMAMTMVASPALAYHHNSVNVDIKKVCKVEVSQANVSSIVNGVTVVSNTGDNDANHNAFGTVNVTTGATTSTVNITNVSGGNFAVVPACCGGTCSL